MYLLLLILPLFAFAQVDPAQTAATLKPVLEIMTAMFPDWLINIFVLVGGLRVIFKPMMAFLEAITVYTPSKKDDVLYKELKEGNVYKWFVFLVDYIASIKLPKK